MRRRRMGKKAVVVTMTAVALSSIGALPAFAEVAPIESVNLIKKVPTDGKTYSPATSFSFELTEGDAGTFKDEVVYAGISGGLTLDPNNSFDFTPGNEGVLAEYSKTGAILVDATKFTTPGIYHYQVKEVIPEAVADRYEGITYDDSVYDVYVYVENNSDYTGYIVSAVKATKDNGETKSDDLMFRNDYDGVHKLTLMKEVTGNQGNRDKEFEFTIQVNGQENEKYATNYTLADGSTLVLTSGADAVTVSLKHGESIEVYGLSANDVYTIVEASYASDGYQTPIAGADSSDGLTATGKTDTGDDTVVYTNDKTITSPTGIAMEFGPYALMLGAAGALGGVFFRKKREE